MVIKYLVCGLFLFIFSGYQPTFSAETKLNTLILAADMPDIFDTKVGKYAELRTLINQQKKLTNSNSFFIFGGGSLGPSAMSAFDKGSHIIDILNTLEPDVMGVTKREFSYLSDELSLRAYESAFPIVVTNVIDSRINNRPDGLSTIRLIQKDGVKLGFISLVNSRLIEEYLIEDIVVLEPMLSAQRAARELRKLGADVVLLHYSYPFDFISELLDTNVIDLAFLSDTRLQEQYQSTATEHPKILYLDEPGTAIKAVFTFDSAFTLVSVASIDLKEIAPNPATQSIIDGYQARLKRMLDEKVGVWSGNYSTRREDVRACESAFANFVVDAMKDFGQADIALLNGGSIRGDKTYLHNTAILRRDIATELPFRSRLNILDVSGAALVNALEVGFSKVSDLKGGFPQVSGMQIKFDSASPVGQRVKSVKINGANIDPDKFYTLATTDYLAKGGDGYTALESQKPAASPQVSDTILIADLVIQAIAAQGKLHSETENRIVDIAADTAPVSPHSSRNQ
jgi:2',3'-cyclic-nucleotide 2'-phosphodiesterase (5'-nucleotidase family)